LWNSLAAFAATARGWQKAARRKKNKSTPGAFTGGIFAIRCKNGANGSFETQIFCSGAITKIPQCCRIAGFFCCVWAEKMVSKPILPLVKAPLTGCSCIGPLSLGELGSATSNAPLAHCHADAPTPSPLSRQPLGDGKKPLVA